MRYGKRMKRQMTGFLTAVMLFGMVPAGSMPKAQAATWVDESLNKLVTWGVMRGDQSGSLNPNREITRSEFVTMINRAYGYDEAGKTPFEDITTSDWYYDDIGIAYTSGYFSGTSTSTATPNGKLTREQATVILGRNLMLEEGVGEIVEFTDGRSFSAWSRGIAKTAKSQGIVNGYTDGSFKPQNNITRGEVAVMLVNALGNLISQTGTYTLGSVYSNVTISSSGVTLRDTTIAGDLYLTGGLNTGYITLENVTVLGKIVVSGAGESNKGDSSIVMRNVTAKEMLVDSLSGQFVTVRAEGDTEIDAIQVGISAYLEDRTEAGIGFKDIEFTAENGSVLELAGNIEEVINKTPGSAVRMAKGQAASITVDEAAIGSSVEVSSGGVVKELNLDVATKVTGTGDVQSLKVNAAGCSTTMLPDEITIRPGLTANIAGTVMDQVSAAESSLDPKLLSGYPAAADVAPTSCSAVFSTNKPGTVYWAITSISDGSVSSGDLISPPVYSSKIVKSGNVKVAASSTETTAKISGLISDGSYYLSAVLVDSRGASSPVKVAAFTTPDDSIPAFASGYPYISKLTNTSAQVVVMPTKTCQLYYAVLPKGSTSPTAQELKVGAVSGNYGYGSLDVTKNTTRTFTVNNKVLTELVSYDLYLWLTSADGGKSSAVKKLTFTTVDKTPPVFNTEPTVTSSKATSIGLTSNLNEAGTVYWVAVKEGTEYPKPLAGQGTGAVALDSDTAKLQVASGMNAVKSGKVTVSANKDAAINISGLEQQAAYDIYYIAQDKAGNYSESVKKITANTLDNIAPTVTQEFTRYNGTDKTTPLADTDIKIIFSEGVQKATSTENVSLAALYDSVKTAATADAKQTAQARLAAALRSTIMMYSVGTDSRAAKVQERTANETNWVIDYRNAMVEMKDGKTVVTFPTSTTSSESALNLSSGSSYYFQIEDIADTSTAKNIMGVTKLTTFTTVFAQVNLATTGQTSGTVGDDTVTFDMSFQMTPVSTAKVADDISWDMLLWCDTSVEFTLYSRTKNSEGAAGAWRALATKSITNTGDPAYVGLSLTRDFLTSAQQPAFGALNALDQNTVYEYAISFTKVAGQSDRAVWSQRVNCKVTIAAGSKGTLSNLSVSVTPSDWTSAQADGATSIGLPAEFTLKKQFTDQKSPVFTGGYPTFEASDSKVNMTLLLDRSGTIYYAVAPVGLIITRDENGNNLTSAQIPTEGSGSVSVPTLSLPGYLDIVNPKYSNAKIKTGNRAVGTGATELLVEGLEPETEYYVYFVLKGTGQVFSQVQCYRFTTTEVSRPQITLDIQNPKVNITTSQNANLDYALLVDGKLPSQFSKPFKNYAQDTAPALYLSDSYTVLNAMIDGVTENNTLVGSVFDVYATSAAKDTFATLIRNQKTDGGDVVLRGNATVSSNGYTTVDCKNYMSGNTWYCFLAVGRNVLGTGDAFRAIRPVFLQDTTPPMVTSCSTTIEFSNTQLPPKTLADAMSRTYSGSVTIIFSEQIYHVERTTTEQTITPIEAKNSLTASAGYTSLAPLLTLPATATVNIKERTGDCTSVQFTFTGLRYNESITLSSSIGDASGNVHVNTPLSMTLNVTQADTDGNYIPTFKITKAWDGTQ